MTNIQEKTEMDFREKSKLCLLGAVGGAVLISIIGFGFGGWVKGATADKMARDRADTAVVNSLAPICVAQFLQAPGKDERLAEMKGLELWRRAEYVKKQGWATMPGGGDPSYSVADECAKRLSKL